jgi:hypothetical protein
MPCVTSPNARPGAGPMSLGGSQNAQTRRPQLGSESPRKS